MALYENIKPNLPVPPPPPPIINKPVNTRPQQPQTNLFQQDIGYAYHDFYPYSPEDSDLWLELFVITDRVNRDFTERLFLIRSRGTQLILDQQFGFRLQPIINPNDTSGWHERCNSNRPDCNNCSDPCYEKGRAQIMPYANEFIRALGELRKKYDNGWIIKR